MSPALLDNFWLRMAAMYGHTWSSQYGANPEGLGGDTWAAALSGLNGLQIAEGLRGALSLGGEFPPSAPRFRSLCFGVPSLAAVRADLKFEHGRRAPFTRMVWHELDGFAFARAEQDRADRMLRDAYEMAREKIMQGFPLPAAVEEIAPPEIPVRVPAKEETVRQHLAELGALLGEREAEEASCP